MDLSHRRHVEWGHAQELFALIIGQKKTVVVMSLCFRIRPSKFESQILMLKKESNLLDPQFLLCLGLLQGRRKGK